VKSKSACENKDSTYPSTIANDEFSNMVLNEACCTVSQVADPTVTLQQHAECHTLAEQENRRHLVPRQNSLDILTTVHYTQM